MKLGLALGGGGARGFAHIGFLQVMREHEIEFDVVAGTSIGALVGAVYCADRINQLTTEVLQIKVRDIPGLLSPSWSLGGLFSGKNVLELLSEVIGVDTFDALSKPFAAVTVDAQRGEVSVLHQGDLSQAIRASIAIPGLFTPVIEGEHIFIDGATMEPVPVEACRAFGADKVIAVDLFSKSLPPEVKRKGSVESALEHVESIANKLGITERLSVFDRLKKRPMTMIQLLEQTLAVMQRRITELRLNEQPADLVITPAVANFGTLDFHLGKVAIALGRSEALSRIADIRKLADR